MKSSDIDPIPIYAQQLLQLTNESRLHCVLGSNTLLHLNWKVGVGYLAYEGFLLDSRYCILYRSVRRSTMDSPCHIWIQ